MLTERQIAARRLLKEDFAAYAKVALTIRTKEGEIRPLYPLKPAQALLQEEIDRQLSETGMVRIITLKARQQGLSTVISAYAYFNLSQRRGGKGIVLTHKKDSTDALFGMYRRYHDGCPEPLKPSTKYSSKKELYFDVLDTQLTVATAGGSGVARGETNTFVHASELAFWPKNTAGEIWNGLRQSVADVPGTFIFIESTANGASGAFFDLCQGAMQGKNEYTLVFIPWYLDPDYQRRSPVPLERTPEEDDLAAQALRDWSITLTDAQLYWRRLKIAEVGEDKFKQEYPATPQEAFLASGRPVFDPERVVPMLDAATARAKAGVQRQALSPMGEWDDNARGELTVYHEAEPGEMYVIGADVAHGIPGCDYSVATVLDSKKRVCAVWRGHLIPDEFAGVLAKLGERYNLAELVVENNGPGQLCCYVLQKGLLYPFLYQSTQYDKLTDKETEVVGFNTNVKTKPLIVDKLRAAIRNGEVEIFDVDTLDEMRRYVVTETGKMEGDEGSHDDCVMALALANHGHTGIQPGVPMTDEWYEVAL